MGKRLENLSFRPDTPLPPPRPPNELVQSFIEDLNALLDDEGYRWAWETIAGIRETIRTHQRVTQGQRQAITNVLAGQARGNGRGRTRRYEGFGR